MSKPSYATYVKDRMSGFEGSERSAPIRGADMMDFPDYARASAGGMGASGVRMKRPACTGPIAYRDRDALQTDLANFKNALSGASPAEAFVSAADTAREVHGISLDPDECYRVIELNFAKEDLKIYLTSGYLVFAKPIQGGRQGAVFVATADAGDAEILLMPPTRGERLSLATFAGSPNLEEYFNTAVFIFTDGTGEDLLARAMQHEIDHLNGILFIKHVSTLKRDLIRRKIRKLQKAGEWD